MTHNKILSERFARLRRQAEERVKQWRDLDHHTHEELRMVVYELRIHLAELEIQNEALKREMQQMNARRRKNSIIYEFGPLKKKTAQH